MSNPILLTLQSTHGFLTWLVGLEGPLFPGIDDVGHGDAGVEAGVIGHLGLLHICAVADGVDMAAALHLEVLVHPQGTVASQVTFCREEPTLTPVP